MEAVVLVHGGAGDISDSRVPGKMQGVKKAAALGYAKLRDGGSVVDAVEMAVRVMEDDEAFNAGYGSVLNRDGEVEMDASVMIGANLNSGAVSVVKNIANPISLARMVMEKTPHFLLVAEGANRFAEEQKIPILATGALVSDFAQESYEQMKEVWLNKVFNQSSTDSKQNQEFFFKDHGHVSEVGTVGAVAIDSRGRMAAATSTGGLSFKMVGRASDSSVIGSGTYADDNVGAVSTTGHGESIARFCLAHTIINEIKYNGLNASAATTKSVKEMFSRLKHTAGAITISKSGEIGIDFTSKRMAWAYQIKDEIHSGIDHGQHLKVKV